MDEERLPRRMLSCWVPRKRPAGGQLMTLGRSLAKAMEVFRLDPARWPELAADRAAWRAMLRSGEAPDGFRRAPAPMLPMPISMTRPTRAAAARTNDAIVSTIAELRNTTKLGRRFCEVTNLYI